ncbi:MAG: TetR/AcrR family transcriptional regulator [Hyphomicrobiales bacterium]|nr:MAG: TetR/AcrR family transcriptional regulator [Hyphomicrobiales bacterium]
MVDPDTQMTEADADTVSTPADAADAGKNPDNAKRRQIIDGACRMFLSQGFDAASMGAIAKAAGVSKGTLYVYFKSKEDLFEAIVFEQARKQAEQIFDFDNGADMGQELHRLGTQFVKFVCRKEGGISPLRTVIAIADRMPELGARFYAWGPASGIAKLKSYFDAKVAQGALRAHDTEVAAAQFLDACLSLTFKPLMFNAAPQPSDALIERVVSTAVATYLAAYKV